MALANMSQKKKKKKKKTKLRQCFFIHSSFFRTFVGDY